MSIARQSHASLAYAYIAKLKDACKEFELAARRGETRFGLKKTFRTIGFDRRISIVFEVSDEEEIVRIVSFQYARRDWTPATKQFS